MEADWAVSLGSGDPVITVPWAASSTCRFVDLRVTPHLIDDIAEVQESPVLRAALLELNSPQSPFWTAKCDAWANSSQADAPLFDPDEMNADAEEVLIGVGSYVDLLRADVEFRSSFERHVQWMRIAVERLRSAAARAARVDLVLRAAQVEDEPCFAVTWFVEACGRSMQEALQNWTGAFDSSLQVMLDASGDQAR